MPTNWTTGEMDKFLETYKLQKLTEEVVENVNRQMPSRESE